MKLIDLFAGSRSVAGVADEMGWETFSTDIEPYEGINLVKDIFNVKVTDFPFVPDVVWASPPCTFFSVGSIGKHWNKDHTPKTNQAVYGTMLVKRTVELIFALKARNPNLIWWMENPRGKLRKLEVVKGLPRYTVCYCQYGDTRMKPTDIWSNTQIWKPKAMCFNGNLNCHHEPAPRGSKTGTQGLANPFEKSRIPKLLVKEVLRVSAFEHLMIQLLKLK